VFSNWVQKRLKEVNILKLDPGDILVLRFDCLINVEQQRHIADEIHRIAPHDTKVLILTKDTGIDVIKSGVIE